MGRVKKPDPFHTDYSTLELSYTLPLEVEAFCKKTLPLIGGFNFLKDHNKIPEVLGDKHGSPQKIH